MHPATSAYISTLVSYDVQQRKETIADYAARDVPLLLPADDTEWLARVTAARTSQALKREAEFTARNFPTLLDSLHTGNKATRTFFTSFTGASLGKTMKETRTALLAYCGVEEATVAPKPDKAAEKERKRKEKMDADLSEMIRFWEGDCNGGYRVRSRRQWLDGLHRDGYRTLKHVVTTGPVLHFALTGDGSSQQLTRVSEVEYLRQLGVEREYTVKRLTKADAEEVAERLIAGETVEGWDTEDLKGEVKRLLREVAKDAVMLARKIELGEMIRRLG